YSGSSPNPTRIIARAPLETERRICSAGSAGMPCCCRSWFRQRMKSGAVSIRVPSRSKSTAAGVCSVFTGIPGMHQVIDVDIPPKLVHLGDGVVSHAGEFADFQPGMAKMVGHLR